MKRILFILHNHFVNDARVLKEARSLVQAGHEVTVRCLGDGVAPAIENYDGITIERKHDMPREKHYSMLSKMLHIWWFMLKATRKARTFDAVHCHDLAMLPVGVWIKLRYGKKHKLVYDCHEHETEVKRSSAWMHPVSRLLERSMIGFADAIICVSNLIAKDYVRLYNISKPYIVMNCPPLWEANEKKDLFREAFDIPKDHSIFLYQGALIKARNIPLILECFARLGDIKASLVMMGYGYHTEDARKAAKQHENIYYHDAVPADILLNYTASADVGLLLTEDDCLSSRYSLPNKLFEYQMAGLPVIAVDLPEIAQVLHANNTGALIEEPTVEKLETLIRELSNETLDDLRSRLSLTTKTYNWEAQASVLLQLYADLSAEGAIQAQ